MPSIVVFSTEPIEPPDSASGLLNSVQFVSNSEVVQNGQVSFHDIIALLMADVIDSLVLDLVEWVAVKERTYEEVMSAWRTSCPQLTVWEEANDRGLVEVLLTDGKSIVRATPRGIALLAERRPMSPAGPNAPVRL